MRLIYAFLCLLLCTTYLSGQSSRPFLEIGKRDIGARVRIHPIHPDSSTSGVLYFRTDSTMKWARLGGGASQLTPLFLTDPLLAKDFKKFEKTRVAGGICAVGGVLTTLTTTIGGLAYALSNLGEIRPGDKPKDNSGIKYFFIGSSVSMVGLIASTVYLRKRSRLQLVNLINRYNDHRLSAIPFPADKGWSLSIGLSCTENSVGVGLRLRPD